jgi:electron transport complex protein RnfG
MREWLRFLLVLPLITAAAGLLLGGTERCTRAPIAAQHRQQRLQALRAVLPAVDNAPDRDVLTLSCGRDAQGKECTVTYYLGRRQGQLVGVAFEVVAEKGYGGPIVLMVGVAPDGTVFRLEVLAQNETPGLGNRIEEPDFRQQFAGKSLAAARWQVKKDGGDFDQLSGATISSRAVVEALAAGLRTYHRHAAEIIAEGG